jgi:TonB-linked SusC/RagA family outer membrane protein
MKMKSLLIKRGLKPVFLALTAFLLMSSAIAQKITLSGTVFDNSTKESLVGAAIMIEGTTSGTITDMDGKFTMQAEQGQVLVVSFIGYESMKITVAEKDLKIGLNPNYKSLEEVIVSGYTTQKKKDLTGAVAVVDMDEMKKSPNNNVVQSLQGRVPGMVITTDGSPSGGNTTVRLRGIGTLNNNDPLYIIDGVPSKAGMHELNPNDIESIQVLKDASSATIYGSKAANGVIIVTTKKAKKGVKITANVRTSLSWYSTMMDVLDAEGYGRAFWQAKVNNGQDPNANSIRYSFDWTTDAKGTPVLNKVILPEYLDDAKTMKTANTNWFKEISQVGVSKTYDVAVMNGSDKGGTMFSVDYTDNQGIIKSTDFKRLSARLNSDYKLLDNKLIIGENFTINKTRETQEPGVLNLALQSMPTVPVNTVDGKGWGGPVGGMNDRHNPVRLIEDNDQNHYDYLRLFGNVYADLEIIKNLHARTSLGIDYGNYNKRYMQLSYKSGYLNNPLNIVQNDQSNTTKWIWSNTLTYNLTKGKHAFDALAGIEMFSQKDEAFWAKRQVFESEDPDYMYLDAGTGTKDNGGYASEYALLSYFGKVNYAFDEKYLVSATLRYDGSSRFGVNKQFATFPAFSLGWRVNNESFIKNNFSFISDLKLRYGWGQTGNQEIANNATYTIYTTNYSGGDPTWRTPDGTAYDLSGAGTGNLPSGYQITQRGNDDLKWETTTQSNIGIDFGFLNQKIYGSFEYFEKKTDDILVLPAYIAVIGEGGNHWVNGASMENKGIEFQMGFHQSLNNGLNFDISGNIATYRNKVTKLPEEVVNNYGGNGTTDNILNRPINTGYGYVTDGLFRTTDELANSAEQSGKDLGRIRFKDVNGDGVINTADRAWICTPHPDYTYGLNITANYKGFDFSLFFQGVGKIDVVNDVKYSTDFWAVSETGSNKGTRLLDAWSPNNPNSDIPALLSDDKNGENRFSTYFVENGAYLKLRNIQLGYTLPKNLVERIKLSKLHIYVSGQNLLTFKSKSFTGVDPETPNYGYPIPSMVTTGINITF